MRCITTRLRAALLFRLTGERPRRTKDPALRAAVSVIVRRSATRGSRLAVGQATTVDLTLPVGELKQVVTVEEAPSPVSLSTQSPNFALEESVAFQVQQNYFEELQRNRFFLSQGADENGPLLISLAERQHGFQTVLRPFGNRPHPLFRV